MTKLWWAIFAQTVAAILAFFQLQGHYVWPEIKFFKTMWWVYGTSVIIAPLFFYSTIWSYEHFGAFWNMRLAGFGIGTLVFGTLAWILIGEIPTMKTFVCLLLAAAIILIQVTNIK
jgi:FlaA1/EpsC-like NDP-sugar epimerase|tara:strand:+ start:685 stop:1032 length:348 start_codon:yes stop_codon:yes gene_type:complete